MGLCSDSVAEQPILLMVPVKKKKET